MKQFETDGLNHRVRDGDQEEINFCSKTDSTYPLNTAALARNLHVVKIALKYLGMKP